MNEIEQARERRPAFGVVKKFVSYFSVVLTIFLAGADRTCERYYYIQQTTFIIFWSSLPSGSRGRRRRRGIGAACAF